MKPIILKLIPAWPHRDCHKNNRKGHITVLQRNMANVFATGSLPQQSRFRIVCCCGHTWAAVCTCTLACDDLAFRCTLTDRREAPLSLSLSPRSRQPFRILKLTERQHCLNLGGGHSRHILQILNNSGTFCRFQKSQAHLCIAAQNMRSTEW